MFLVPNNSKSSNVSDLVKADYAATRKETAPEVFIKHWEGVIQPVNRAVMPEMHEDFCLLWLTQKPGKLTKQKHVKFKEYLKAAGSLTEHVGVNNKISASGLTYA